MSLSASGEALTEKEKPLLEAQRSLEAARNVQGCNMKAYELVSRLKALNLSDF
ncbi:hypothetical protein CES85_2784 (plasmid) [Ochrobactrum quorumnocens]|uniref:Uncharacterized protein n=1 Tax=Ochrobactrum quorumnocens TaxID=271865 RepID=A0A248UN13_9HYPH|nr:hypothetical protein CES85_2784 [[Ochrobactrum] quorumnocens]